MFFEYEKEIKEKLEDYDLLVDGHIKIPSHVWVDITTNFSKKEIIEHLSKIIEDNNLPYPSPVYQSHVLKQDFKKLKRESNRVKEGVWECMRTLPPNVPLTFNETPYYIQATSHGLKISDQFAHIERAKCGHFNHRSPWKEWTREDHVSKLRPVLRVMWGLQKEDCLKKGVGKKQLRDCLRLANFLASQFKPSCARSLYNFFGAKRVLDFSAGWGDRLVGFLASNAESYVGIDPNTKMHTVYQQVVDYCNVGKETKLICSPAEDADLSDVKVDFVFTSPPYFDIERYSEEDTQSWKRYGDIDSWLVGFLFPTLKKCWECLEDGGRIAINITDKGHVTDTERTIICEPMLTYMESLGATFEGIIGYRMNKRPGLDMGDVGGAIHCEPIWIWSKGKAPMPSQDEDLFFLT